MKKLLVGLCAIFICTFALAHSVEWYVDGSLYQTTTCDAGDNITPPTAPTKYGYHFDKWSYYAMLKYIESTGTQYIDTGYYPNQNTKFEISGTQANADSALFGLSLVFYCFNNDGSTTFYSFCGNAGNFVFSMQGVPVVLTMSASDGIIINGTKYTDLTAGSTTANYSMTLFGRKNNNTGVVEKLGAHKINYAKIYDNNVLVRNLIPAKRNSDNAVGMYDTVNGRFFTNQGTGEFIAGPEVGSL